MLYLNLGLYCHSQESLGISKHKEIESYEKSPVRDGDAVKRLAWGMDYKDCTKEDFEEVIFIDENMVERSKDSKGIWVFRILEEKWHKDCIHGVTKGLGIKLMAWACIWERNEG